MTDLNRVQTRSERGWLSFLTAFNPLVSPLQALNISEDDIRQFEDPFQAVAPDQWLRQLARMLNRLSPDHGIGQQQSWLKGQGLDFADLREYTPGDDVRRMDWQVYARTMTPHIREYHDEKQLVIWVILDLSASMHYCSGYDARLSNLKTKAQWAIECLGLLGVAAQSGQHQLGVCLLGDNGYKLLQPGYGPAHTQQLMSQVFSIYHQQRVHNQKPLNRSDSASPELNRWGCQLQAFSRLVGKQTTVVCLSDFLNQDVLNSDQELWVWEKALGDIASRARLCTLLIRDPMELALVSGMGLLPLQRQRSNHTGNILWLDSDDARVRRAYQQAMRIQAEQVQDRLSRMGQVCSVTPQENPSDALMALFKSVQFRRRVDRRTSQRGAG